MLLVKSNLVILLLISDHKTRFTSQKHREEANWANEEFLWIY